LKIHFVAVSLQCLTKDSSLRTTISYIPPTPPSNVDQYGFPADTPCLIEVVSTVFPAENYLDNTIITGMLPNLNITFERESHKGVHVPSELRNSREYVPVLAWQFGYSENSTAGEDSLFALTFSIAMQHSSGVVSVGGQIGPMQMRSQLSSAWRYPFVCRLTRNCTLAATLREPMSDVDKHKLPSNAPLQKQSRLHVAVRGIEMLYLQPVIDEQLTFLYSFASMFLHALQLNGLLTKSDNSDNQNPVPEYTERHREHRHKYVLANHSMLGNVFDSDKTLSLGLAWLGLAWLGLAWLGLT
jgi:hypothetical protein